MAIPLAGTATARRTGGELTVSVTKLGEIVTEILSAAEPTPWEIPRIEMTQATESSAESIPSEMKPGGITKAHESGHEQTRWGILRIVTIMATASGVARILSAIPDAVEGKRGEKGPGSISRPPKK